MWRILRPREVNSKHVWNSILPDQHTRKTLSKFKTAANCLCNGNIALTHQVKVAPIKSIIHEWRPMLKHLEHFLKHGYLRQHVTIDQCFWKYLHGSTKAQVSLQTTINVTNPVQSRCCSLRLKPTGFFQRVLHDVGDANWKTSKLYL